MKKLFLVSASLALISAQAEAQVRPGDCRPVFPVVDRVAEIPQVPVPLPPPAAVASHFNAAWLLIPLAFATGLILITHDHHHHHNEPVSPA